MSIASPKEGQLTRTTPLTFDSNLEILDSDGSSISQITADGEDRAAPDMTSNTIDLGPAVFQGRACFRGVVIDVASSNERAEFTLMGYDEAGTTKIQLASLAIGALELTGNTADDTGGNFDILFENVRAGVVYPKLKLEITNFGDVAALDIAKAFIVPL